MQRGAKPSPNCRNWQASVPTSWPNMLASPWALPRRPRNDPRPEHDGSATLHPRRRPTLTRSNSGTQSARREPWPPARSATPECRGRHDGARQRHRRSRRRVHAERGDPFQAKLRPVGRGCGRRSGRRVTGLAREQEVAVEIWIRQIFFGQTRPGRWVASSLIPHPQHCRLPGSNVKVS